MQTNSVIIYIRCNLEVKARSLSESPLLATPNQGLAMPLNAVCMFIGSSMLLSYLLALVHVYECICITHPMHEISYAQSCVYLTSLHQCYMRHAFLLIDQISRYDGRLALMICAGTGFCSHFMITKSLVCLFRCFMTLLTDSLLPFLSSA